MYFNRLAAATLPWRSACESLQIARQPFSTSSAAHAGYKMKSHSGAKKRWRSLASGVAFKRGKAFRSHLNVDKTPSRVNRLGQTAYATDTQAIRLKKQLLPYGSN